MKLKKYISILFLFFTVSTYGQVDYGVMPKEDEQILLTIRGFDFYKADQLTEGANLNNPEILDTVFNYLSEYNDLKVVLEFYAACKFNSQNYVDNWTSLVANICANILIGNGIDPDRIKTKGMGNIGLIEGCKCGECSEQQLERNRRLEVKIRKE